MRLINTDEIRIKPEYMHDICGVVMIRVEDIARILNDMSPIELNYHCTLCEYCKYHVQEDDYWYCNKWQRETKKDWACNRGGEKE